MNKDSEKINTAVRANRIKKRVQSQRLAAQSLEQIQETLACGSPEDKKELLTALCPCRNRRYDREVWIEVFRAAAEGETGEVRDQAGHAIGTLMERARTDPRTQEMLRKLIDDGAISPTKGEAIPQWRPGLRGEGLYIPRYEHSPRSKSNRRK